MCKFFRNHSFRSHLSRAIVSLCLWFAIASSASVLASESYKEDVPEKADVSDNTVKHLKWPYVDEFGFAISFGSLDLVAGMDDTPVVVVPGEVHTIAESACNGLVDWQVLILPEGLKRIEKCAFYGSKLKYVNIPSTVTIIEDDAFERSSIKYIEMREAPMKYIGKEFRELDIDVWMLPEEARTVQSDIFEYSYVPFGDGETTVSKATPHVSVNRLYVSSAEVLRGLPRLGPDRFSGISHTLIPPHLEASYRNFYPGNDSIEVCERALIPVVYCKNWLETKLWLNKEYQFDYRLLTYGDATPEYGEWRLSTGGIDGDPIPPELATINGFGVVRTHGAYGKFFVQYIITDQYGREYMEETECSVVNPKSIVDEIDAGPSLLDGVYDLQGRYLGLELEGLSPGLYIVRHGNTTQKVIL